MGKELRRAREARGWSQEELARRLRVSSHSVSTWERGEHSPGWKNARKLREFIESVEPPEPCPLCGHVEAS